MIEYTACIHGIERPFKSKYSLIRISGPGRRYKTTLLVALMDGELRYYLIAHRHKEFIMHTCFFDPIEYCATIPERHTVLSLDTPHVSFSMAINLRILSHNFLVYYRNAGIR